MDSNSASGCHLNAPQVKYETQVFEESQALNKQFAELNKVFPAVVRRTKKVLLDLMTVDEAIDAMEAVGHDFFVFRWERVDVVEECKG